jgi:2-amino-4-hydroxy-6-hydroxymethyldihydropteridine diphosphokinase
VARTPVAVALGSNLGDREAHLQGALAALALLLDGLHASTPLVTEPVGVGPQPDFLNMAAVGHAALPPRALLEALLEIEARAGRSRPHPGAPRTLDLDLILYGEEVIEAPGLCVPHPRFRERGFVLTPLAEIAGDWRDPVTGLRVAELRARLPAATGDR